MKRIGRLRLTALEPAINCTNTNTIFTSIILRTRQAMRSFGMAVNMKFSKVTFNTESLCTMKSLIKTYLQRGGFELQINVLDGEQLKEARRHPEEYKDLVVRIGGYSDYFTRLSPEMQAEVILRTEHEV